MTPTDGDPDRSIYHTPKPDGYQVTLSAIVDGASVASTVVTRRLQAPGAHRTELRPESAGFFGTYVAPPAGTRPLPAVLAFGGAEGGAGTGTSEAEILAAHGYPALGLAYFGVAGRPESLDRIPLEYFATALRWLRAQPGVDPAHVLVWGVSRGGEAARNATCSRKSGCANTSAGPDTAGPGVCMSASQTGPSSPAGRGPTCRTYHPSTNGQPLLYSCRAAAGSTNRSQPQCSTVTIVRSSVTGWKVNSTSLALAGSAPGCQLIRTRRGGSQSRTVPHTASAPSGPHSTTRPSRNATVPSGAEDQAP
jgi:hypothetical protein